VLRSASDAAFRIKGRALLAGDIIDQLPSSLELTFPNA